MKFGSAFSKLFHRKEQSNPSDDKGSSKETTTDSVDSSSSMLDTLLLLSKDAARFLAEDDVPLDAEPILKDDTAATRRSPAVDGSIITAAVEDYRRELRFYRNFYNTVSKLELTYRSKGGKNRFDEIQFIQSIMNALPSPSELQEMPPVTYEQHVHQRHTLKTNLYILQGACIYIRERIKHSYKDSWAETKAKIWSTLWDHTDATDGSQLKCILTEYTSTITSADEQLSSLAHLKTYLMEPSVASRVKLPNQLPDPSLKHDTTHLPESLPQFLNMIDGFIDIIATQFSNTLPSERVEVGELSSKADDSGMSSPLSSGHTGA